MTNTKNLSLQEIVGQPATWQQTLTALVEEQDRISDFITQQKPEEIIISACGSTYWGALTVASVMQELTGIATRAVTSGHLLLYPETILSGERRTVLLAPSRSGKTSETLGAVELFRKKAKGAVLSICSDGEAPIAQASDLVLELPWAMEQSICQTRSYTAITLAGLFLAANWSNNHALLEELMALPRAGEVFLARYREQLIELGHSSWWHCCVSLGQGPLFGYACEGALILIEMSQTPSNYYQTLEVRHGPTVLMDESNLVLLFRSDRARRYEGRVLSELQKKGSHVVVITGEDMKPMSGTTEFIVEGKIGELGRGLVGSMVPQLLANQRAIAKGLDPDRPVGLVPWITLDTVS